MAEDLVGGAAPSVAEEGQMVAGVVRATAVEEVDFQVLQEDVLVGTKNILQVLTLGADTRQVELAVAAAARGTPAEVVEMILVIVVTAVWMVQVTPPVITVITDLLSHNANV